MKKKSKLSRGKPKQIRTKQINRQNKQEQNKTKTSNGERWRKMTPASKNQSLLWKSQSQPINICFHNHIPINIIFNHSIQPKKIHYILLQIYYVQIKRNIYLPTCIFFLSNGLFFLIQNAWPVEALIWV